MTVKRFATRLIEGSGGMNEFERKELVIFHTSDRVASSIWTIKCLANVDCKGSELALEAILDKRGLKAVPK